MNHRSFLLYSRNSLIMLLLFVGCLMVTCENEPEPLTANSVIYGSAELYWPPEGEQPNIKVTACGPYGQQSTFADEAGNFIFSGLGNGTYYLEYSQDGYGTIRQYGLRLFGNDTVHAESVDLFKKVGSYVMPTFTSAFISTHNSRLSVWIETDLSSDDYAGGIPVMLFFNDKSNVSWENYGYSYPAWDNQFNPNNISVPTIFVDTYFLPFKSGTKVFIIGYVCNYNEYNTGYLDTYLGSRIYSTLDKTRHSNVVSFIMP
jgi:hypothetical protein